VQDFSVDVPDYKKDVKGLEQDCLDTEEIADPYARFMPLQKSTHGRRSPSSAMRRRYKFRVGACLWLRISS
jgi:hypothetical protein